MFFLVFVLFLDCFFNMHLCAKLQPYSSNKIVASNLTAVKQSLNDCLTAVICILCLLTKNHRIASLCEFLALETPVSRPWDCSLVRKRLQSHGRETFVSCWRNSNILPRNCRLLLERLETLVNNPCCHSPTFPLGVPYVSVQLLRETKGNLR